MAKKEVLLMTGRSMPMGFLNFFPGSNSPSLLAWCGRIAVY
jgi:hypothetical protein